MKKSVILVGLLLMGLQMFGQYKIEGQIKNHGGRILLLVQDAIGQYDTLGNSITADGKFCFTGKVEQPIAAEIRAVNTRLCFPVFLENGNYEIDADVKQPKAYKVVGGGEMQDLRNEFRKKEFMLQHECDSLRKEYEKTYGKDDYFGMFLWPTTAWTQLSSPSCPHTLSARPLSTACAATASIPA